MGVKEKGKQTRTSICHIMSCLFIFIFRAEMLLDLLPFRFILLTNVCITYSIIIRCQSKVPLQYCFCVYFLGDPSYSHGKGISRFFFGRRGRLSFLRLFMPKAIFLGFLYEHRSGKHMGSDGKLINDSKVTKTNFFSVNFFFFLFPFCRIIGFHGHSLL